MGSRQNLAQLNIAAMREPLDSPGMADFVTNIDRINSVAEAAPGFVWRLKDDPPENPFGAMTLVNLSVWENIESLSDYVHKSAHLLRRTGPTPDAFTFAARHEPPVQAR